MQLTILSSFYGLVGAILRHSCPLALKQPPVLLVVDVFRNSERCRARWEQRLYTANRLSSYSNFERLSFYLFVFLGMMLMSW